MSIRLRLTLLYSAILSLSLVAFSVVLYAVQARLTYDSIRANLMRQGNAIANPRPFPGAGEQPPGDVGPPGPFPFDESQLGGTLPGRWTQVRGMDGAVTGRTADLAETTLPLSEKGLLAVQAGADWFETGTVQEEPLLIYSRPFVPPDGVTRIVQVAFPIAEQENSLRSLRWILIVGDLLVIGLAFAAGWVLAGLALRPIGEITQTAQAIGVERDFSRRVEHEGPADELGQLALTLNGMLAELEGAYRQVEQALDSQRRFVADASHELRTPLTTVRGNIELLRREPPLEAQERAEVWADTTEEVERLIRLVNQLLVLARADAGQALEREPLAVQTLLDDVVRQARQLSSREIAVAEISEGATVLGDQDALKQVLLILVDNALVHTPANAVVELAAASVDGEVAISVHDTGPGIEPEALPHIFERFYRGQVSRSGTGMGLGLAIARELVEAQGGTIAVESRQGEGSTFVVRLAEGEHGRTRTNTD